MATEAKQLQPVTLEPAGTFNALQLAIEKGVSPETLEKIVALQERILERDGRMAFAAAMAAFQGECPPITKNKTATNQGRPMYQFAELDHIAEKIRPLLQKHGLSYRFDSTIEEDRVKVVCIVRHIAGHSESANFEAPVDGTSMMNKAQKAASALSYARRYALILALGLTTTGDQDDDGRSTGKASHMDEQAVADHLAAIDAAADADSLQKAYSSATTAAKEANDGEAYSQFESAKNRAKARIKRATK